MSAATEGPITFIVPGRERTVAVSRSREARAPLPGGLRQGRVKQSVDLVTQRDGASAARVTAVPGEDVVVLQIAGGPELVLHPGNARDLLLAQSTIPVGRGAGDGTVPVPSRLRWRGLEQAGPSGGATRGALGDVIISAVHVVTDMVKGPLVDLTVSEIRDHFDSQAGDGVYPLRADALSRLKDSGIHPGPVPSAGAQNILVFIHGTFSETHGTFGKLWANHPQRVRSLFRAYGDRVYALDHPTLGVSPIANAITLAKALPDGTRLHLVTHSRGGLVAEVLAHACTTGSGGDPELFAALEYKEQGGQIAELIALVQERQIRVDRVVRVACPARGTLLASNRLDAYISVFKWTLQLAGIPVAPELVDFLGAVAQRRTDPMEIPGLAAQSPDSPLVKWLHSVDKQIDGQLRVVAGDLEGDSVTSWLKTLLADSFYWTDNDLVVQTRSMYGGGPRAADASFLLDAGGSVSHFNYFTNDRTAEAIVDALLHDAPKGFSPIGPLSWAGESPTGVRAAAIATAPQPNKPAVFVLPGILGSNLAVGKQRIWLGWRLINGLAGLKYPDAAHVTADGPIGRVYDELMAFLAATHEVIPFAFDWRLPIEQSARELAAAVAAAVDARRTTGKPVRMLAHSMGGLLARTMQLEVPSAWDSMMAHADARLLMLGTPNGGSWAPMQVLSGDDTFGNVLAAAGAPFQAHEARALMAQFPGFIQLQAGLLDDKLALGRHETWQQLADNDRMTVENHSWWHNVTLQRRAIEWGVPPQDVLDHAVDLRTRLDHQRDTALAPFMSKLLLVTGRARLTPDGYETTGEGFAYLSTPDTGDGRVTRESALLPNIRTWTLDCEHGSLPGKREAFTAYLELLETGTTELLELLPAVVASRGAAADVPRLRVRSRPSRSAAPSRPVQDEGEVLSAESREPASRGPASSGTALRVTVHNGDLTFIHQPLMLGHYHSSLLTGTERVMDDRVGEMDHALRAGLYPDAPGTHAIFVNTTVDPHNPWQLPRPPAVIVVGLGQEGNLQGTDLVTTVRQGVIGWAHRLAEGADRDLPQFFELATTLIGSGGSGITARQAAQLVAEGVREANERLDDDAPAEGDVQPAGAAGVDAQPKSAPRKHRRWPQVSHLHIIELYLERASEALSALQMQAVATPGGFVVTGTVQTGMGALRRPTDAGYRGANYDFVTAVMQSERGDNSVIQYTLDTKRARSEVRAQKAQRRLLLNLVTGASTALNADPQIGRTLFQLLVPIEMEAYLSGTTDLQIELDSGTAGIPWELLDTDIKGRRESRPWAIRVKLLRKMRLSEFRGRVLDADADASALVIGEPKCDAKMYPRLYGARAEAHAVAACLMASQGLGGDRVKALISPDDPDKFGDDARTIINALMERDWRIVHIAGHGELPEMLGAEPVKEDDPPQRVGNPRGVVLSDGSFLGPREINNVRRVPELVFVNCCHLAARDSAELLKKNHVRFAAGVAEALIAIGVRCVIAAGWAVDDAAASMFATTFYRALLNNRCRFIDAVAEAREAAWTLGGNTWAAYQCYGDPDWTFNPRVQDAQRPAAPADEFGGVTSPTALLIALETLAIQSEFQGRNDQLQRDKIRYLENHIEPRWGHIGKIAEAFGKACAEAKDFTGAITWYRRAVEANDATAGMKAAEQLGNLRVRLAWEDVDQAEQHLADARSAAGKDKARHALKAVIRRARQQIESALADLEQLVTAQPTMERASLCGSAYKRLAMLEAAAKRPAAETQAIAKMEAHYRNGELLGRKHHLDFFYPATNRMAAELALHAGAPHWKGFKQATVNEMRRLLKAKAHDNPDFWSVGGVTELRMYEAIAAGDLSGRLKEIQIAYTDLHGRLPAPLKWKSVYDTALFVSRTYVKRAPAKEKAAIRELLTMLAAWAKGQEWPVQSV